jgi:hypothetical protein
VREAPWHRVMEEELQAIEENHTWTLIELPPCRCGRGVHPSRSDGSCQVASRAGRSGGVEGPSHGREDGVSEWRLAGGYLRGTTVGIHMIRSRAQGIALT